MTVCSSISETSSVVWLYGAIAAVLGGLLSGVPEGLIKWLRRPKLRIDFVDNDDFILDVSWQRDGKLVNHRFVRVRLTNCGSRVAENCRVYCVGIKELSNGRVLKTKFNSPLQLSWPGWTFESRPLYSRVPLFVELVSVDKDVSSWEFKIQGMSASQADLQRTIVPYRFILAAVSDNAKPYLFEIDLDYNGDWHKLRVLPKQ